LILCSIFGTIALMKHVRKEVLRPGMVVATDLVVNGKLIMPQGHVLTEKTISRLDSYGVRSLRIEDPGFEVEELPLDAEILFDEPESEGPDLSSVDDMLAALTGITLSEDEQPDITVTQQEEPSHFEKLKSGKEFQEFRAAFTENVDSLKSEMNDIVEKNKPIDVDDMISNTLSIIKSQSNTFSVFDMLHNMRDFDDLTYTHSMNVAMICNVFAHWLGYGEKTIELATACGMLHDIGKLKISDDIIKKPGKLTDEEFRMIKAHPLEGYHILEKQDIDKRIKLAALEHHEKCDGSGYPMHLTREKIDGYAKIVAIADVYDAMTANRCYREGLCPFRVVEIFEDEGLHKYETSYIMTFLENVVNTYIDNRVMLNDGSIGTVRWINKQRLSKPMIQMSDGSFIELAKNRGLRIEKIL